MGDAIWNLVTQSAVASPIVQAKAQDLRRHDYAPTFTVSQMRKNMRLILDTAEELGVDAPLAAQIDARCVRRRPTPMPTGTMR